MMSLALVMIAVAVLPAALAATATCTAPLMAVNGVPDKCFWYAYQDVPMTMQYLSNLCQKGAEADGRLFRPRSRDEYTRVTESLVPQKLQNDRHGEYPLDFMRYEQYNETVWGTYTCPFELMAPGMWAKGEPNNGYGDQDCVSSTWESKAPDHGIAGLYDMRCTRTYYSVVCEFPSENWGELTTSLLKNNQSDLKDSIDYRLSTWFDFWLTTKQLSMYFDWDELIMTRLDWLLDATIY